MPSSLGLSRPIPLHLPAAWGLFLPTPDGKEGERDGPKPVYFRQISLP